MERKSVSSKTFSSLRCGYDLCLLGGRVALNAVNQTAIELPFRRHFRTSQASETQAVFSGTDRYEPVLPVPEFGLNVGFSPATRPDPGPGADVGGGPPLAHRSVAGDLGAIWRSAKIGGPTHSPLSRSTSFYGLSPPLTGTFRRLLTGTLEAFAPTPGTAPIASAMSNASCTGSPSFK